MKLKHMLWIPAAGAIGFVASFVFGDLLALPLDIYYLVYFSIVIGFFIYYVKRSEFHWRMWIGRRLDWGLILGVIVGILMLQNVLSRPETDHFSGTTLARAVVWRGFAYGAVDGLLLFAFPWIVVWRAFEAERAGWGRKIGASIVSWVCILIVTTAYHLGYSDFRSAKIVQPDIGATIMAVPTLATANPVASPITHVFLHVTAVVHSPHTELFLPPHRDTDERQERSPRPVCLDAFATHKEVLMAARGKAILFGFLIWLAAFVVAFLIFPIRESARPLFESIMPVVVTSATAAFTVVYFRGLRNHYLKEGVLLGALWLAINVLIDAPLMLLGGPMKMTLGQYVADIGLTYLIIPAVTVGIGLSCERVSTISGNVSGAS